MPLSQDGPDTLQLRDAGLERLETQPILDTAARLSARPSCRVVHTEVHSRARAMIHLNLLNDRGLWTQQSERSKQQRLCQPIQHTSYHR
eukprot:1686077-Pyramimonas_sp.AAC.1